MAAPDSDATRERPVSLPNVRTGVDDSLPPIGVFWDIENCHVPRNKSAVAIVKVIRANFFYGHREAEFMCVCDINKESKEVIQELNDAQVTVVHINATCKNAADDKLRQCMRRFAYTHGAPSTVILISGDVNFTPDLSDLRHWRKLTVIVIHNGMASEPLLACANHHCTLNSLLIDVPEKAPNKLSPVKNSWDLIVSNLPTTQDVGHIKNRLKRLSNNCGGKVIYTSGDKARLRFSNLDAASRARKRMDGEDVYGNQISVNFPSTGTIATSGRDTSPHCTGKKSRSVKGNSPDWTRKPILNGTSIKATATSKSDVAPLKNPPFGSVRNGKEFATVLGQSWGRNSSPASLINPLLSLSMRDGFLHAESAPAGKTKPPIDRLQHQKSFPGNQGVTTMNSRGGWIWNGHASVDGGQSLQYLAVNDNIKDGGQRDGALPTFGDPGGFSTGYGPSGNWRWSDGGGGLRSSGLSNRFNSISPQPYAGSWSSSSSSSSSHISAPTVSLRNSGQVYDGIDAEVSSEPVELHITNLDHCKDVSEMKQYLVTLFQEHVMVLHISLNVCPDGTLSANVKVPSIQDAHYAISQLHRRRIGSKRILISLVNCNSTLPLSVLRPDVAALLLDVPGHKLPLFKFRELFEKRYHRSIGTSELHKLKDMVVVQENANGRIVALVSDYRNTPSPASSDGSKEVQDILDSAHCEIHCRNHYEGIGWAEKEQALQLPNVVVSLKVLAPRIHRLLEVHTNSVPLNSLSTCYECEFGKLDVVEEGGVPLEHLVTCIPGVHIVRGPSRIKKLGWIDEKATERPEFRTVSPPLANQLALFCREIVDLLKNHPYCRMPFAKFIPTYHHHFGRQCRVADYGYTKLVDLFDALTHVVQVIGEGSKRMLTLTHRAQVKRFTTDLLRILKAQMNKQIVLSEFADAYQKCLGKSFDICNYGVCDLADILPEVAEGTIMITWNGPDTLIAIPKREQTLEEADRTKEFAQEAMELLRHSPRYRMAFTKFIPAYHHHFGRQCRVADYGFTKLIELFEAIPQYVEVLASEDDGEDKMLLLAKSEMIRVFAEQIDTMMKAPGRQIMTLDKFRSVFIQAHGYNLHPEDFGVDSIRELLEMILHVVKVVDTASGPVVTAVEQGLSFCVRKILLEEAGGRMKLNEFCSAFKQRYGQKCDVGQLTSTLKDYVKLEGNGPNRTIGLHPFHLLFPNVVNLLKELSGRLPLSHFEDAYFQKFGQPLNSGLYGYANTTSLLQAMHEIVFIRGRSSKKSVVLNQEGSCYLALFHSGRPLISSRNKLATTTINPNLDERISAAVDLLSGPIPTRIPSPVLRPLPAVSSNSELILFDSPTEDSLDATLEYQDVNGVDLTCQSSVDTLQLCNLMADACSESTVYSVQPSPPSRIPCFPPPSLVSTVPEVWMQQSQGHFNEFESSLPMSPVQVTPKTPLGCHQDSSENEINTPPCIRELIAPSSAESTSSRTSESHVRHRPRLAAQFSAAGFPSSN